MYLDGNPLTLPRPRGVKLPPRAHFCLLLRQLDQQPKFLRWLFLNMFSARNGGSLDILWLRVMTCQSDVIFLRKNEICIYTFKCSGIMENWIKHELFHSNNEVSWWHVMTHDNMSSHDIRHMTYVIRQGMTYGHKIWHQTSCLCHCE